MAYSSWLAGTLGVAGCVTCDGRCCECVMGLPPPCMCDGTRAVSLLASEEISRFSLSVQKERKKKNTRYYFSCVRLIDPNNARFPYASAIGWQRGHAHRSNKPCQPQLHNWTTASAPLQRWRHGRVVWLWSCRFQSVMLKLVFPSYKKEEISVSVKRWELICCQAVFTFQ
jgi:hypothetical protein